MRALCHGCGFQKNAGGPKGIPLYGGKLQQLLGYGGDRGREGTRGDDEGADRDMQRDGLSRCWLVTLDSEKQVFLLLEGRPEFQAARVFVLRRLASILNQADKS